MAGDMNLKLDPQGVKNIAKRLHDSADLYREYSNKLISNARDTQAHWKGDDNDKFIEQLDPLSKDLLNMADQLELASQTMMSQVGMFADHIDVSMQNASMLPHS